MMTDEQLARFSLSSGVSTRAHKHIRTFLRFMYVHHYSRKSPVRPTFFVFNYIQFLLEKIENVDKLINVQNIAKLQKDYNPSDSPPSPVAGPIASLGPVREKKNQWENSSVAEN